MEREKKRGQDPRPFLVMIGDLDLLEMRDIKQKKYLESVKKKINRKKK